jgi:DAACS family dicarboxylate/amino acid:cation (Na+ or H+) symporter
VAQILGALVLGLIVGPFVGPWVGIFGDVSKWVIQLIKALAVPLLFLAIVNAVNQTQVTWKAGRRMVGIALLNASLALAIGLGLAAWIRPGDSLRPLWQQGASVSTSTAAAQPELRIDVRKSMSAWIPQSVGQPFVDNAVIPAVILAVILGLALRREREAQLKADASSLSRWEIWNHAWESAQKVAERTLFFVVKLIPLAVFSAVASAVAKFGYSPLQALGVYLGVALLGLSLQIGLVYQAWVAWFSPIRLKDFWLEAKTPVVQSIGTNSSLATLPFTLRALDRLKVSRHASALGACVGTNLNNDGILLYEGMAMIMVVQALGLDLSWSQQLLAAGLCMLTGMGVAGVPDAGFISLSLVLATVGLPVEQLPLLLSVDWILGRARSVTNVLSDMTLSIAIDGRSER